MNDVSKLFLFFVALSFLVLSCSRGQEIAREDIEALKNEYAARILERTITKPGPPEYSIGSSGGEYRTSINSDVKSFNLLNIRDASSASIVDFFSETLFDYDAYTKEFLPGLAESFRVEHDEEKKITYVYILLRDNLYWSTANGSRVPVYSDDIIFWHDDVEGNEKLQMPGYAGQFITMEDGSKKRIEIEKIDERQFRFVLPRFLANPLLYINTNFGPRYIYEKARRESGIEGMLNALSIDTDPRDVPSVGSYYLVEYQPGQRVVLERNPDYWQFDDAEQRLPYIERRVIRIASEETSLLLLKEGELSARSLQNSELDELLEIEDPSFSIYNAGTGLGASFFSFNQNVNVVEEHKLRWFSSKKFRQAMSRLLPRQRIVDEIHRGFATPAHYFFARANIFFDETIQLQYTFNLERAMQILREDGFSLQDEQLYDSLGVPVEFDIFFGVENKIAKDTVILFSQELAKVGIKANVRPIDFQNLVERITKSYMWDVILVGLGANYWPSGGSNVWQSKGNFHIWYPLQSSPATEWEREIDELYQKGLHTIDNDERKKIYDRYQRIILEELPLIYTVYTNSFIAYDKKLENIFVDTLQGSEGIYYYFLEP